tara:strand:+ start:1077 stop:2429 length:1353 start_codon:yes stop_codon:yes gene_type:complete
MTLPRDELARKQREAAQEAEAKKESAEQEQQRRKQEAKQRADSQAYKEAFERENRGVADWALVPKEKEENQDKKAVELEAGTEPTAARPKGLYERKGGGDYAQMEWDGVSKLKLFPRSGGMNTADDIINALDFMASQGTGDCYIEWFPKNIWGTGLTVGPKQLDVIKEVLNRLEANPRNPPQRITLGEGVLKALTSQGNEKEKGVAPKYYAMIAQAERISKRYDEYMAQREADKPLEKAPPLNNEEVSKKHQEMTDKLKSTEKKPTTPEEKEAVKNKAFGSESEPDKKLPKVKEQLSKLEEREKAIKEASSYLETEKEKYKKALDSGDPEQMQQAKESLEATKESREALMQAMTSAKGDVHGLLEVWRAELNNPDYKLASSSPTVEPEPEQKAGSALQAKPELSLPQQVQARMDALDDAPAKTQAMQAEFNNIQSALDEQLRNRRSNAPK